MMHHITRSAVAAVAALAASVALAEDAKLPAEGDAVYPYGHSGAWYVFADTTGGTCMTEKVDDAGNVVQIGMTKDGEHAYLAVYALIPEDLREKREKIKRERRSSAHGQSRLRVCGLNAPSRDRPGCLAETFYLQAA